jgi:hypothetical protein
MTKHEEFLRERQYLHNVSQRTLEWHRQSLKWLAVPNPSEGDVKNVVIRGKQVSRLQVSIVVCVASTLISLGSVASYERPV